MDGLKTIGEAIDPGLMGLILIARSHRVAADPDMLRHQAGSNDRDFSEIELLKAAKTLGLKARTVIESIEKLTTTPLPCLALHTKGNRFVIVGVEAMRVLIYQPATGENLFLSYAELEVQWAGRVILFASRSSLVGEFARFDFT